MRAKNPRRIMDRRWLKFTALLGLWLVVGLILTLEVYFNLRADANGRAVGFWDVGTPQFIRAVM